MFSSIGLCRARFADHFGKKDIQIYPINKRVSIEILKTFDCV